MAGMVIRSAMTRAAQAAVLGGDPRRFSIAPPRATPVTFCRFLRLIYT